MAFSEKGFQIENTLFPLARKRINEALAALASSNYGNGNPPVMVPFMFQVLEQGGKLVARVRNAQNTGWEYNLFGGTTVPAGAGVDYFGATLPDGWLWRDGAKYQQTQQPDLFAAIGTKFNTGGEAVGEFRVPDDRSRVAVGAGSGYALASKGGFVDAPIGREHLPRYNLRIEQSTHKHPLARGVGAGSGNESGVVFRSDFSDTVDFEGMAGNTANIAVSLDGGTENGNGPQAQFSLMQPYLVCNKIIKA